MTASTFVEDGCELRALRAAAAVVIVTYMSNDELWDCLRSIPQGCEVVVVNQPSADDPSQIVSERPRTRLVHAVSNRGFGAACNLGVTHVTRDVVIFLNPDARLASDAVELLVAEVLANGGTAVGPRILDTMGRELTECRRFSRVRQDIVSMVVPKRLQPKGLQREIPRNDSVYRDGGPVPYVQGSCLAISTEMFRLVGGFNEDFFLYGEEECLARALVRRGLSQRLEPNASITHIGHTSTDTVADFAVAQMFRSRMLTYRRSLRSGPRFLGIVATTLILLLFSVTHRARKLCRYRADWDAAWCRAALRGVLRGCVAQRTTEPRASRPDADADAESVLELV